MIEITFITVYKSNLIDCALPTLAIINVVMFFHLRLCLHHAYKFSEK